MSKTLHLSEYPVVTLIGAGGKTSTMYELAHQMGSENKKVLITTTTKIYYVPDDKEHFFSDELYENLFYKLQKHVYPGHFLVAGIGVKSGKVLGIKPEWVDRLAESRLFDLILVEGDGSAQKPLKAPTNLEPVIPSSTSLILPVMGLDVVGQPLHDQVVHRVEKLKEVTKLQNGEKIKFHDIYRVFIDPSGYDILKLKEKYRVVPIINKVDDKDLEYIGGQLAKLFTQAGIDQVLLTSHLKTPILRRVYQ